MHDYKSIQYYIDKAQKERSEYLNQWLDQKFAKAGSSIRRWFGKTSMTMRVIVLRTASLAVLAVVISALS